MTNLIYTGPDGSQTVTLAANNEGRVYIKRHADGEYTVAAIKTDNEAWAGEALKYYGASEQKQAWAQATRWAEQLTAKYIAASN